MKKLKLCLIGGGSYAWTDSLYMGFANNPFFNRDNCELWLYDIKEEALNNVYAYITMVNDANPDNAIGVRKTTNIEEAMEGADIFADDDADETDESDDTSVTDDEEEDSEM